MISGFFLLDWALLTVSVFNAIVPFWLGLTIWLNAEKRTWGVGLMVCGLLLGTLFFISHSVILVHELMRRTVSLNFWWHVGWIPVIIAPFAWYLVMLWYAGFGEDPANPLYRRHLPWLMLAGTGTLSLIGVLLAINSLPTYYQVVQLDLSSQVELADIPLLFALYPVFAILCIGLSFDALNHPQPSQRMMGELARQRSRPWLIGAAVMLLLVSLLVTGFLAWAIMKQGVFIRDGGAVVRGVVIFDLVLSLLIAGVILLVGQAIVAYEVFTGKTLPRRGFFRQWRNAVLVSASMSLLLGFIFVYRLLHVYSLLLTTLIMMGFYALFHWRSFVEREQFIVSLRPFVRSQQLIQQLINPQEDSTSRAQAIFQAICHDILGTQQAYLLPMGTLAPLAGQPLSYPQPIEPVRLEPALFADPAGLMIELDPGQYQGLCWAIPLWAERGLIGALLLGEKLDRGLYTQEEIEIARASAERIIDTLSGEQMARRLMDVQRRRMAETRVLDLRTRRTLHDDILPALHAAVLEINGLGQPAAQKVVQNLMRLHGQISDLIHAPTMPGVGQELLTSLRLLIDDEFAGVFQAVHWQTESNAPMLEPLVYEVLYGAAREAIRNAAVHGAADQRPLHLTIQTSQDHCLKLLIQDNGVGVGNSTAIKPGSGRGLALHSTLLAIVGGHLTISSPPDGGTQVRIEVPL